MGPTDADLARIAETLNRHGVEYVMVGGGAAQFHGADRPTRDVDVVTKSDHENLRRLGAALLELRAQIRDAPPLPASIMAAQLHPDALRERQFGNWNTDAGELDTALFIGGGDEHLDYERTPTPSHRGGVLRGPIVVAGLRDLIRSKELAGRERDLAALPGLRALLP